MKSSTHVHLDPRAREFRRRHCIPNKCGHHTRLTYLCIETFLAEHEDMARPSIPPTSNHTDTVKEYLAKHNITKPDVDVISTKLDVGYRTIMRTFGPKALASHWEDVA